MMNHLTMRNLIRISRVRYKIVYFTITKHQQVLIAIQTNIRVKTTINLCFI